MESTRSGLGKLLSGWSAAIQTCLPLIAVALIARVATTGFVAALAVAPIAQVANAGELDRIHAAQLRPSTPNFQLLLNLSPTGTTVSSGPMFSPAGGFYGMAFLDDTLYGLELDNVNLTDYYLATIPHEGALVGQGVRVGANPVGVSGLESLAVVDGTLFATAVNTGAHLTALLTIDPVTGIWSNVGFMARNIIIEGMAYDPTTETLYGAAVPFGQGEPTAVDDPTLYTIDPNTAAATAVGVLGVRLESLAWDATAGLVGAFDSLYSIDTGTGAATMLGSLDFTDGIPGSNNGVWAMGALVPELPTGVCGEPVSAASRDGVAGRASPAGRASAAGRNNLAAAPRSVTASDALAILQASVGSLVCELCVCDVDGNGSVAATDALAALKIAVGQPVPLNCPACT